MVKFEKNKLIINGVVIKEFNYQIRTIVEVEDTIIVLLEIPFDNTIEKNKIVAVDFQGKIIWITNNHGYVKNNLPFEQMIFKDGWIYASDFYARRFKINYRTGDIENVTIAK